MRRTLIAFCLGIALTALALGPRVEAQPQNIVTLYGCSNSSPTIATCTRQPVAVNSSGFVQVIGQ